ncbi:MAG: diadenylate cyclase CdaA [Bacillota bacterium]
MTARDLVIAAVDIMLMSYLIYKVLVLIRGTRAVQLLKGIIVLLIATSVSQWLKLYTINWLLVNLRNMLFVALPVVFQPELRRALEQVGRGRFFSVQFPVMGEEDVGRVIEELVKAVMRLSRNNIGGLIVVERETGLNDYIETGIRLEALVTAEMIQNIFVPNTPLHDGAVIIRGDRIMAAACFLPLTEAPNLGVEVGSRHRAALGITEHSDAIAIVVSEETSMISLANGGKLIRHLDEKTLRQMLTSLLHVKATPMRLFHRAG